MGCIGLWWGEIKKEMAPFKAMDSAVLHFHAGDVQDIKTSVVIIAKMKKNKCFIIEN